MKNKTLKCNRVDKQKKKKQHTRRKQRTMKRHTRRIHYKGGTHPKLNELIGQLLQRYTIIPSPLVDYPFFNNNAKNATDIPRLLYLIKTQNKNSFKDTMNNVDALLALTALGLNAETLKKYYNMPKSHNDFSLGINNNELVANNNELVAIDTPKK